jgi:hypothetical protein
MTFSDAIKVGLAVVASLGGGGAIVLGLSRYLGQIWIDRLKGQLDERLRRLDSDLKQRNFLLQRFAEYELEGLVECWRAARACVPLINATRPLDSGTDKDVLAKRTKALSDGHNALLATTIKHEPFLPVDIIATLDAISTTLRFELSQINRGTPFVTDADRDWWDEGKKNRDKVEELSAVLLRQVRERARTLRAEQE